MKKVIVVTIFCAIALSQNMFSMRRRRRSSEAHAPIDSTLIYEAAKRGDLQEVKRLAKTPEIRHIHTKVSNDFKTPLMAAAEGGHLNVVKFLVDKGAKINKVVIPFDPKDPFTFSKQKKRSALSLAAQAGRRNVVKYLLGLRRLEITPFAVKAAATPEIEKMLIKGRSRRLKAKYPHRYEARKFRGAKQMLKD